MTRTFPESEGRKTTFYVDGAALNGEADLRADPSLRRLDLRRLVKRASVDNVSSIVWIDPARSSDSFSAEEDFAYAAALRKLGIECRTPLTEATPQECLRCGHGWEDGASASALALTLGVLMDASRDTFDQAIIFADRHVVTALQAAARMMFPTKQVVRLQIGRATRLARPDELLTLREDVYRACRLQLPADDAAPALARSATRSGLRSASPLTYLPS